MVGERGGGGGDLELGGGGGDLEPGGQAREGGARANSVILVGSSMPDGDDDCLGLWMRVNACLCLVPDMHTPTVWGGGKGGEK